MENIPRNKIHSHVDQSAEAILSGVTDGSPVAIFVIDRRHRVIHWNKALEALTGITRKEVMGTRDQWRAFFNSPREVLADLILDGASVEEIEQLYENKSKGPALIEGAYESEGFFIRALKGKERWLHFTASPIKDGNGRIIGAIETLEDITERKLAEEALRKSERRYRNLFERAMDAIWVNDASGNIQDANQSAARLTGYSREELRRSNLKLFMTESSLKKAINIQENLLLDHPLNNSYEQRIIHKDGSQVVCMVTTNIITSNDPGASFQSIARDITEAKRAFDNQQYYLKEISRAQEEERKRIARDLHDSTAQNLIALLHQLENLLDDKSNMPLGQVKSLWSIYERMRDILQEVRRFSRDLRPSILDDLGLIPALEWLSEETKSNYNIETSLVKIGEERRLTPEAELLSFRIVQESLANVVKHAKASKAEIKVQFAENKFLVTITDNGVGFSPPQHNGELIRSSKLGLAGMQERIQLLGGNLKITSRPDQGTSIQVEAPI